MTTIIIVKHTERKNIIWRSSFKNKSLAKKPYNITYISTPPKNKKVQAYVRTKHKSIKALKETISLELGK